MVLWENGTPAPQSFGTVNSLVLALYLILLVGMGVYFSRRAASTQDFFLAGGRIPWWAAGVSIFATTLSAITYLSIPAHLTTLEQPDQLFPWFIATEMPAGLAGLVIAGIFAATMSSLDSSLHAITTAITMATWDLRALWGIFLDIIGLFLGMLGGLFILGIFTRRPAAVHAWLGAMASVGTLAYCTYATALSGLLFGAIGTVVCVVVAWTSSFLLPVRRRDLTGLTIYSVNALVIP